MCAVEAEVKDERAFTSALPSSEDETNPREVAFEGPTDPNDPTNWTKHYKWTTIILISLMTLVVNLATVMCAPAMPLILEEFRTENKTYNTITVSIWELGEAFAPLFIAPLSEMLGRRPIYNGANCLLVIFSIAGAVSTSIGQLLAFRFLTGLSVASVVLNPCLVSDMFVHQERGSALSIMSLAPVLGPVTGPIIGGYMSVSIGWRSTFWFTAIAAGVLELAFISIYRESYKPRILQRKATQLQKQYGQVYSTKYNKISGSELLLKSLVRPARMLFLSPVLFLLAAYLAVVIGYLFLLLTTITEVFESIYGFSTGTASLTFLGLSLGMTGGMFACRFTLDRRVVTLSARNAFTPEAARLPLMLIGASFFPPGLVLYGWTAAAHAPWILPLLGLALVGAGIALTIVPSFGYVFDTFGVHAGSAIAATLCLRGIVGAFLPLAGPSLYRALGLGWGNSLLALVAVAFVPLLLFIWRFGNRVRKASKLKVET